ncbi:MAG: hypothetical protein LAN83_17185 [Acidobacteriia bacterium]|nr:hypothetical protein [Terriglobia bacterium]
MSKRMTLVVGTICTNGLFFCSDTEEGTVMGGKRTVQKLIHVSAFPQWHLVFGTAGFGPLCELAMRRISDAARLNKNEFLAKHETIIGDEMVRIYDKYIPDSLPDWKRLDRQISLVIGVVDYQTTDCRLYQTYEEIVYPVAGMFACAGVGQEIAYYFLDRLFRDARGPQFSGTVPEVLEAQALLEFVMKEAKESVGNVGGNTETIAVITSPNPSSTESSFGAGWEARQPQLQDIIKYFWLKRAPKP